MVKDEIPYRILNLDQDLVLHFKQYPKVLQKDFIILHDTGVSVKQPIKVINEYHKSQKMNFIGYDIYIESQYTYETKRLYDNMIGAHARGWNNKSIGICLAGNKDNNAYQFESLRKILDALLSIKNFTILFHKDLSKLRNDPNEDVLKMVMTEYPNNSKGGRLYRFEILGQTPSSKNSPQVFIKGGRIFHIPNKNYLKWKDDAINNY